MTALGSNLYVSSPSGQKATPSSTFVWYELFDGMFKKTFDLVSRVSTRLTDFDQKGTDLISAPFYGSVDAVDYAYGENLLTSTDAASLRTLSKIKRSIQADLPVRSGAVFPDVDFLWSPAGAQEAATIAQRLGAANGRTNAFRAYSSIIQSIWMPDTATQAGSLNSRATAGRQAGFLARASQTAANYGAGDDSTHYDMIGHDVVAALATTGAAVEDELWKFKTYLDGLGVPDNDRVCALSPRAYRLLGQHAGFPALNSGATTPTTKSFASTIIGANGNWAEGEVYRIAGFDIWMEPHLGNFGTKLNSFSWATISSSEPTSATGKKYLPYEGGTDQCLLFNGLYGGPTTTKVAQLDAAGTPQVMTGWGNGLRDFLSFFDKLEMIAWHPEIAGCLWTERPNARSSDELSVDGTLLRARHINGFGPMRPECGCMAFSGDPA